MNLKAQQSMLLKAIFDPQPPAAADSMILSSQSWPQSQCFRGLDAYRSNATILAHRVLMAAFPTLVKQMGDEFPVFARHYWRSNPPIKGDLAQWGAGLADFLRSIPDLMAHEPHLPDVAALDWALHAGQTAADGPSDTAVPLAVIDSPFPIVDWVNGKDIVDSCDIEGQRALVYRQGFKTACISISKDIDL